MHPLRGKCKEECDKLMKKEPSLTLVRGFYWEPLWNTEEPHWWTVDANGVINDPTKDQFPSGGIISHYTEFNGIAICEQCGADIKEADIIPMGRYPTCSNICARRLVGI